MSQSPPLLPHSGDRARLGKACGEGESDLVAKDHTTASDAVREALGQYLKLS
jgi:hypothetical protein